MNQSLRREFVEAVRDIAKGNLSAGIFILCIGLMYASMSVFPCRARHWFVFGISALAATGFVVGGIFLIVLSVMKLKRFQNKEK
jgi:hypothetical protein